METACQPMQSSCRMTNAFIAVALSTQIDTAVRLGKSEFFEQVNSQNFKSNKLCQFSAEYIGCLKNLHSDVIDGIQSSEGQLTPDSCQAMCTNYTFYGNTKMLS